MDQLMLYLTQLKISWLILLCSSTHGLANKDREAGSQESLIKVNKLHIYRVWEEGTGVQYLESGCNTGR